MKSLIDHPATTLTWQRSGFSPPDFELVGQAGVFATLGFLDDDHTLVRARTAEGDWTLKHLGILTPAVTLREIGGKDNLAIFHPHLLRHGKLQFADGPVFEWAWHRGAEAGGAFLDPGGKPLLRLRVRPGTPPGSAGDLERCEVELVPTALTRSRTALLAAFGWFLILFDHMKEKDAAASADMALRI
jgi:hypothetical protein